MVIELADIVRAMCGRDRGKFFVVTKVDGGFAFIADGRGRRLEKPKRKNLKHLIPVEKPGGRLAEKLSEGQKVTNAEIRRALAGYLTAGPGEKGGMHIG